MPIYVLQGHHIKFNTFYIGETDQMFAKCMNGHRSTGANSNCGTNPHQVPLESFSGMLFIHSRPHQPPI